MEATRGQGFADALGRWNLEDGGSDAAIRDQDAI